MKRSLLILLLLACMGCTSVQAQYFTLRFAGGYAWPGFLNDESIVGPGINSKTPAEDVLVPLVNSNDRDSSYKLLKGSYGHGMNFTFGCGYMFNNYIGIDLGVGFTQSVTMSVTQTHGMYLPDPTSPGGFDSTGAYLNCKISTQAIGVSLMPSIVINGAKPGWKVYPYGRFGLTLPVWGNLKDKISVDLDSAFATSAGLLNYVGKAPYFLGKHTDVVLQTQGTVSLGVNAAIGVAYQPLPCLKVFAEINGQYLNTRAKSSQITEWNADGVSKLAARGTYRTQFNYVDQLSNTSNNADYNPNYDPTKPKDDIRPVGPFSNMGFNVGLTVCLSKHILAASKKENKNTKGN